MKIKNWRLYTADGEFIVNLKVLLRSTLILTGGTIFFITILAIITVYGHNAMMVLMDML